MRNIMRMQVLGMKRYSIKDERGTNEATTVWVQSKPTETGPDALGDEVMKLAAPYALLDTCRGLTFPGEYDCEVEIRSGAQNKISLFLCSVTPGVRQPSSNSAKV